jgi:hypothetical protein
VPRARTTAWFTNSCTRPVLYLDRNLKPVPGLAKSWTISPDGLTYRFELNEKATFSDGSPVRASDVVFTLRKIADPTTEAPQVAGQFDQLDLARTRAIADHTVEVGFGSRGPVSSSTSRPSSSLPEHVYSKGDFNSDFNDLAVGSGPYKLVKRERGKEIVVERRADYWRERPHIQTVVFKIIADHGTAWNALKLGEIDETILTSDTWLRERTNPALTRTIDFQRFYRLNYNFIAWNNRRPLFADKKHPARDGDVRADRGDHPGSVSRHCPRDQRSVHAGRVRVQSFRAADLASILPRRKRILGRRPGWIDRDGRLESSTKAERSSRSRCCIIPGNAVTTQFTQTVQAETEEDRVQVEIRPVDGASDHAASPAPATSTPPTWAGSSTPIPIAIAVSQLAVPAARGLNFRLLLESRG